MQTPATAVLICCTACDLVRIADDYTAAHARGQTHTKFSGHLRLTYAPIRAPERLRLAAALEQRRRNSGKEYSRNECTGVRAA